MATVDTTAAKAIVRDRYARLADEAFQAMLLEMEANAPRDQGTMTQTITLQAENGDDRITRSIHAPQEYSSYQDEGTGPIYASPGHVLHFFLKDGTEVFARSTRGVPRTGWWTDVVSRLGDFLAAALHN